MSETLTPQEAARVVAQAHRFEEGLQQRTEGLTQMAWAFVGPGIFLTYAYAASVETFPGWGFSLLWAPWVLAAGATTFALWRSAALSAPQTRDPIGAGGYAARMAAVSLLVALIFTLWNPEHDAAPLLVIGGMYVAFGLLDQWGASRRGRWVSGVVGATLLATAALMVTLPESHLGFAFTVTVAGLAPLCAGLWQTLRG